MQFCVLSLALYVSYSQTTFSSDAFSLIIAVDILDFKTIDRGLIVIFAICVTSLALGNTQYTIEERGSPD